MDTALELDPRHCSKNPFDSNPVHTEQQPMWHQSSCTFRATSLSHLPTRKVKWEDILARFSSSERNGSPCDSAPCSEAMSSTTHSTSEESVFDTWKSYITKNINLSKLHHLREVSQKHDDDAADSTSGTALFHPSLWVRLDADLSLHAESGSTMREHRLRHSSTPKLQPPTTDEHDNVSDGDDEDDDCDVERSDYSSTTDGESGQHRQKVPAFSRKEKRRTAHARLGKIRRSAQTCGATKVPRQRHAVGTMSTGTNGETKYALVKNVRSEQRQAYLTRIMHSKVCERSPLAELR
eukprot:m.186859 g.186859  ORF g.186859 m.186859 type:complete len:294 (+) comp18493_c1_seq2:253-1134(+)